MGWIAGKQNSLSRPGSFYLTEPPLNHQLQLGSVARSILGIGHTAASIDIFLGLQTQEPELVCPPL